jgi:hypothetical protein
MAGYIGKISAVVTANTSLLSRELLKSAQDANNFASSLKKSINRGADAASASIEKIFTPLQMLERKLQQAASRGLKLNMPSDKIRAFVSAAEQINKPLEQASKQFSKLGLDVQAGLLPALNLAQDAAIRVNRQIQRSGQVSAGSFARAEQAVNAVTQALARLSQAESLVGKGFTGNELQFSNPVLFQALQSSARATETAAGLSPQLLADGVIASRVKEIQTYQREALKAQAVLESLELQPNIDPDVIETQKRKVRELAEITKRAADFLFTGLSSSTTPSGEDLADNLEEQNRLKQQAIQRSSESLKIISLEEAAYSRYADAVAKASTKAKELRQAKALQLDADLSPDALDADLDFRQFSAFQQKIGVLKTSLSSLSREEASRATDALQRLGAAVSEALRTKTIRSRGAKNEIQKLEEDAIRAASAILRIPVKELTANLRTAGDVGRRGADKLQLGLQQAAFAVDDFFSVTGDFQQRVRAVSNNLTQLGFIVGKTKGLFITLGAVIATQLVIQIFKWANGNVELRDKVKAANSELEKQKQLVDALTKSYQSLAESARNAGASEAGRTAAERRRQVEEIRRQEEEARRTRIAAVDPESIRLRTEINKLERENENESRAGIAADRQRRIQILERQLAEAERRAASQQTNAQDVADAITAARLRAAEAIEASFDNRMFTNVGVQGGQVTPLEATRRARDEVLQRIRGEPLGDISTPEAQLEALNQAIEDLSEQTAGRQRGFSFLRDPFGSLESQLDQSLQELIKRAEIIRSAIEDQRSSEALIRFSETSLEIADILSRARNRLSDSEDTFLSATADEFAAERERLSQRAVEAREEGNLEFAAAVNVLAEKLERLAREFDTVVAVTSAASTAIERLGGELNQQVLQDAEQLADQARRDQNARIGALRPGVGRENLGGFDRIEAEGILRAARDRFSQVEARNQAAVREFRDRALAGELGGELAQSFAERERLQAQIDAGGLDARAAEAVQDRINELDRLIQRQFEATPAGQAAVGRADEAERQFRRDVERRDAVLRGADALVTDGERAGFEAAQRFSDISALFEAIPATNTPDAQRQQARILEDAQRQVAPALFALTDSVANAVLQGPSRQALNASDISTSQGTAEFLRLLRGDDSSRDQNLIELQRQTEELRRLNATFDAGVAN